MANRTGRKGKKPLQTTLGKASGPNEKEIDLSHVQKPIHTSIFGLRQVLSLFQTATEEVQNYITYECDIMYECRICKTIFRSLANFVLHKRNYCRERFKHLDFLDNDEVSQESECTGYEQDKNNMVSRPVTPDQSKPSSRDTRKDLIPVIEKLKQKQEIQQLAQDCINEDLSKNDSEEDSKILDDKRHQSNNDVLLETIATNNAAVFQTMIQNLPIQSTEKTECMKSEVMEIHGILDSDEAVLGPDGKICDFNTNKINENPIMPKSKLFCTECNLKFSTKKTLTYHIKYKHNHTRLVYVCPDCKDTFANAWCVYRHLYKIHRRTSAQIKRMRDQVHNSCIRRDQESAKKKDKKNTDKIDKTDEENQWLNNIEGDNYFQMCGGCGKRFERKAALHSHAQMCTKRIAVCNTIKENNAKRKEEECKENKNKSPVVEKARPSEVLKGSLKRKPYLLRTYKPNDKQTINQQDEHLLQEVCDVNANNCDTIESNCDSTKPENEENHIESETRNSQTIREVLSSPKDVCASPSVDSIDTEKMLNIIGVTSISENVGVKSSVEQNPSSEEQLPDNRSHTVTEFDIFCQSLADQLELEGEPQKTSKTVPLILRRRNSSKCEKRNTILDKKNEEPCVISKNQDILYVDLDKNVPQYIDENVSETESQNLPSTSSFRITVKRLEDLTGFSSGNVTEKSDQKVQTVTSSDEDVTYSLNNIPIRSNLISETSEIVEVSDTIRANISPEKFQKRVPKPLKRKRTSSFDCVQIAKSSSQEAGSLFKKQDVSFISRASPYMDQSKLLCIPCQLSYATLSKLLWHMSAHFSWFRFQCSRCSFISFNKFDCANHARRNHKVKKKSMQSVVLPIPNWKTVLMAHDFCMLKDENDLSGKHTDEIISGDQEEITIHKEVVEKSDDPNDFDSDNNLFEDINCLDSDADNCCDSYARCSSIKRESINEGIDIVDDTKDSHQLEVPQEIYTLDLSEIMNDADDREAERPNFMSAVKIEKIDYDDENPDSYFMPEENRTTVKNIKSEVMSDNEIAENLPSCKNVALKADKGPETSVNIRPTRNRMRSIKTLQDDFFYDLSKVIKLNDNSVNKPTSQKHRKNNHSDSQKSLRVYSKKK